MKNFYKFSFSLFLIESLFEILFFLNKELWNLILFVRYRTCVQTCTCIFITLYWIKMFIFIILLFINNKNEISRELCLLIFFARTHLQEYIKYFTGIKDVLLIPNLCGYIKARYVRAKKISKHSTLLISFLLLIINKMINMNILILYKMINMHIHACTYVRYLRNIIKFQSSLFRKNKISNRFSIKNNENENLLKFFMYY